MLTRILLILYFNVHILLGEKRIKLPPVNKRFDYQIGGAYDPPPPGVRIVVRDRKANIARRLYNICYINAFQTQPTELQLWDRDLLVQHPNGTLVRDPDWTDEAILDISTSSKRSSIARKIKGWINGCEEKGFDAVEFDNLDTYLRFKDYITLSNAVAYTKILVSHTHSKGLAVAQKNAVEVLPYKDEIGLDFAIAEQCNQYTECDTYLSKYDKRVLVVEYSRSAFDTGCSEYKEKNRKRSYMPIILRDLGVKPKNDPGYVYETCVY